MNIRFTLLVLLLCLFGNVRAQHKAFLKQPIVRHNNIVSGLLQMNQVPTAAKTTVGVPTQRVTSQSTRDNSAGTLTDSVWLGYSGMRKSKYDYNNMMYAYNYPYSTTPMFNYWGIHTTPQVQYDTYVHWTINPFTMPAFALYEGSFAEYDTNNNLVHFKELFVDSVTNDNRSYANTFTATKKISNGYWFNLNLGVEDSAFKQFFAYGAGDRLVADSVYELHLGVWRIAAKSYYTYDGSGNLTQIDHWANVADTSFLLPLVQQSKYVNTYDGSGRLISVFTSIHDGTSLSPYVKDTFSYSGSLTFHNSWHQHQFDEIHGTWWPQYRMTKHIAGSKPDTIYHDGWDSILNKWVPISKDYTRYNTDGNPDTLRNFLYNWTSYSTSPDYTTVYYYTVFTDTTPISVPQVNALDNGKLFLFPNPVQNTLTISAPGIVGSNRHMLIVYNATGQLVSRQTVHPAIQMQLHVGTYAPGMYWVILEDQRTGQRYRERFVKE